MAQATDDLPAGAQLDVFCEACWRIWPHVLREPYRNVRDFGERNRLRCPTCDGNHCRAATPADVTVKPKGGDRI